MLVVSLDVDGGLVDDVHHQRREECDGKDADQVSADADQRRIRVYVDQMMNE